MNYRELFRHAPLIAILRGLIPEQAVAVGTVLVDAGFRLIEVPLNSPDAARSIKILSQTFKGHALIGGGTVLTPGEVEQVQKSGGSFIVSPNCNEAVISRTKECEMVSLPGIATVSEAFVALKSGADGLKIFPAELIPPEGIRAMTAVLPKGVALIPVGGIGRDNMKEYLRAGATGFGFGSSLFKAEYDRQDVSARAYGLIAAYHDLREI